LAQHHGFRCSTTWLNPVVTTAEKHLGLFPQGKRGTGDVRAGIAGVTTRNRGGWYVPHRRWRASGDAALTYVFKNTADDLAYTQNLPRRWNRDRKRRSTPAISLSAFNVSNDELADGGVFTQPGSSPG